MPKNSASRKRKAGSDSEKEEESEREESENENDSDNNDSDNDDEDGDDDDNDDDNDSDNDNDNDDDDNDDDDGSGDDNDDDEPPAKGKKGSKSAKKPAKKAAKPKKSSKASKSSKSSKSSKAPAKKKKKLAVPEAFVGNKVPKSKTFKKSDRLEEARKAYKWWEAPELADDVNWITLEHTGVNFPPNYVQHHIPLVYNGKEIKLNAEQEEIASFFAAMPADGPQLGNPKTKPVFEKNFFEDFKETLPPGHEIKEFSKCNFDLIRDHLNTQKELRKAASEEDKQAKKAEKEEQILHHGYALIDGRIEKVC